MDMTDICRPTDSRVGTGNYRQVFSYMSEGFGGTDTVAVHLLQYSDRSGLTFSFSFVFLHFCFSCFVFSVSFLFERIFTLPFPFALTDSFIFTLTNIFVSVSVNENHCPSAMIISSNPDRLSDFFHCWKVC